MKWFLIIPMWCIGALFLVVAICWLLLGKEPENV